MIEKLLELIAPDECLVCGAEGLCICNNCAQANLVLKKPACPICNAINQNGATCGRCRSRTKLSGATIAFRYEGVAKQLVAQMKYESKRSIARHFGSALLGEVPISNFVVSYVPSDGATRRRRGFDQAKLIARAYAKKNHCEFDTLLLRSRHIRQVGMSRKQRLANVADNFVIKRPVEGQNILLVDDVITTGATASECAKVLKNAGARRVWLLATARG